MLTVSHLMYMLWLLHHLFNIYIQYVINEALEDVEEGVKVGGVRIPAVRFADDQAMVSHTVGLQDCKLLWMHMHCRIHLRSITRESTQRKLNL